MTSIYKEKTLLTTKRYYIFFVDKIKISNEEFSLIPQLISLITSQTSKKSLLQI